MVKVGYLKAKVRVLNDGTFTLGESRRWHESLPPKETSQMSSEVKYIGMAYTRKRL
jgi:hypothetical protein